MAFFVAINHTAQKVGQVNSRKSSLWITPFVD